MYDSDDELGPQYDELGPQHHQLLELGPQHHQHLERQRQLRLNPYGSNNQVRTFAFTNRHESDLSRLGRENLGETYSDGPSYESDSDSDTDEQHRNLRRQLQREEWEERGNVDPPSDEYRYESHSNPDNHPQNPVFNSPVYEFDSDSSADSGDDSDSSADSGDDCEPGSNYREHGDSVRDNFQNLTYSDRESEIDRALRDNMLGPLNHLRFNE